MRLVALAPDPAPPAPSLSSTGGAAIPSSTNGALDVGSDTIIDPSHAVAALAVCCHQLL
jgi:hypothetical protein